MGVMIRFSSLLRDARLLSVFNPRKETRIHNIIVTMVGLLKTKSISALSSTKSDATTKTPAEKRLAIRKLEGSLTCFPPQAAFPYGNPNANSI